MQYVRPDDRDALHRTGSVDGRLAARGRAHPGKRMALPNSRVMIHQPMGGFQGQATDIDIQAREILKMRHRMNEILARAHRQAAWSRSREDTERDYYLSASRGAGVRPDRSGDGAAAIRRSATSTGTAARRARAREASDG